MSFNRIKCPNCGKKVSYFWNYFSLPHMIYTCTNCKIKIKWHPIIRLYNLICGIIMFSIFFILRNYLESPYLSLIIAFIPAQIIFLIIPKKIKIINKNVKDKI